MSDLSTVYQRLAEGVAPSPKDRALIIKDLRRQRAIYESGGKDTKAKSIDDDALASMRKIVNAGKPAKEPMKRRF